MMWRPNDFGMQLYFLMNPRPVLPFAPTIVYGTTKKKFHDDLAFADIDLASLNI